MRYVVTSSEMRALDRATIDEIGLPGAVLMENAGRAVAHNLLARTTPLGHVAVVCGSGNNGGDGYVIARYLRAAGVSATVYLAARHEQLVGDAALHLAVYEQCGGVVCSVPDAASLAEHKAAIEAADVIVDCLFGTGLARPVEGNYRALIELVNRAHAHVVAVDIPSGLSADTGHALGVAVQADHTITMAFLKVGLAVSPGFASCGTVSVADIGIPRDLARLQNIGLAELEARDAASMLPALSPLDHKGRRGNVLVIAGSPGKRGAGRLTSWAALRSGAGLVTVAMDAARQDVVAPDPIMTAALDADAAGALDVLRAISRNRDVVAMGPGMAPGDGGRQLVHAALRELTCPVVLDADALNHLAGDTERVASAVPPVVLTPHPGEAARLLGCTAADIEADRVAAVRELAEASRAVVILKGARTLICDGGAGDGFATVNPTGGPALATAGTGDVLTGLVAALIGQGAPLVSAARCGAYVHGLAADLAADALGDRSVTASDVLDSIPTAFQCLADQAARRMP